MSKQKWKMIALMIAQNYNGYNFVHCVFVVISVYKSVYYCHSYTQELVHTTFKYVYILSFIIIQLYAHKKSILRASSENLSLTAIIYFYNLARRLEQLIYINKKSVYSWSDMWKQLSIQQACYCFKLFSKDTNIKMVNKIHLCCIKDVFSCLFFFKGEKNWRWSSCFINNK